MKTQQKNPIIEAAERLANAHHHAKLSRLHLDKKRKELKDVEDRNYANEKELALAKTASENILIGVK